MTSLAAGDRQGAIVFLMEMTKSDDPARRLQALSLLHESGQADEATILSALRAALPDETTKSYAVQALAERGGPEAIAALRETFRDPDPYVRTLVIESMADQPSPPAATRGHRRPRRRGPRIGHLLVGAGRPGGTAMNRRRSVDLDA